MENKVLITGVAGFIGSHLAEYLISKGYDVYGVDDLSGGYVENVPLGVKLYVSDISDLKVSRSSGVSFGKIFSKIKPDYVYHLAAYAAEGLSPFIRNFNYTNNLIGSVNVINECIKHGVKKIVFTSSMAVYGKGKPPFKESDIPRPEDPYGIAKYAVELDLAQACAQFGLNYAIVRPHNVIGIRQNIWDKYRNVIGIWIRRVLRGESIVVFGDGEQKRAFSDVKFCLEPLERLMHEQNAQVFNIGSDREHTLNEVAEIVRSIAKEFGFKVDVEHLQARHEVKNAYCDHTKAKEILGFIDKTELKSTIRDMFTWAMKQPDRKIERMSYEIDKGMYKFW